MAFMALSMAMALAAQPLAAQPIECDDDCHMSHLQLQVAVGVANATNWAALGGVCMADLPKEYLRQPILDVLRKHPEEDGWCVFGAVDPCISACAACHKLRDVRPYFEVYKQESAVPIKKNATPKTLRFPNGSLLTIRDYVDPIVDIYCHLNGYYDMPRQKLVNDYDYVEKISEAQCASVEWQTSDLSMQRLHDKYYHEADILAGLMAETGISDVNQSLVDSLQAHFVVKCLLGRGKGALCDIPECAWRGCVSHAGSEVIVKYTSLGECPEL
ncbi:Histone-lysine N-methyltransferase EHMT1 [Durusdinium trenchii]|uniref:Histone-lysine N-methyltransferase EHMT1 n=1 Tax=Durusdinium trenchii TaxID=1381693 RepID=A0ABP0PXI8_9DINO